MATTPRNVDGRIGLHRPGLQQAQDRASPPTTCPAPLTAPSITDVHPAPQPFLETILIGCTTVAS